MGCIPAKNNPNSTIIGNCTNTNVEHVKDLKITKGMLVQESKGDPYEFYEEVKVLGEGSFGKVYMVRHKISRVLRAMKSIHKDKTQLREEEEKAMINEINVLKSLDHPNIMKIYEYFNTEKCLYIITELLTGGELFDRISSSNHLSEKVSKYIMKQLLSAVDFCHENGIIHRDLKPENILIESKEDARNEFFTIKLIDFGTSDKLSKGKMCKVQIGTPFYIAPEVLSNSYNEKCDLWSCGVILYIMLCGDPPFYGDTDDEIYASVKRGIVEYSEEEWDQVSKEAKDLINKLLVKNISKRLSAKEALQHEWIKNMDILNNQISNEQLKIIVNNLKKYSATQKLQQATLAFIVHNLISKEDTDILRKCFILFDTNGDGHLDKEEMVYGLSLVLSKEDAKKEVDRIMEIIDVDGNGFIEYEEFLRASLDKKKILTTENVKTVFRIFDKDDSGKITPEELKQVMGQDADIDDNVWTQLVHEIDLNEDGEISFYEFDRMMDLVREDVDNNK